MALAKVKPLPPHIYLTSEYGGGIVCTGCGRREYPALSVLGARADLFIDRFERKHRECSAGRTTRDSGHE